MPSYKEHVLVSLVMVFPFFPEVFYLALGVIGASIIDMDHKINQKNIIIVGLLGIILALILYILQLPYLIGVLMSLMALLFYISEHRGFMHSLIGAVFVTACLSFFIIGAFFLLSDFHLDLKVSLIIISLILGIVILNKKLVPIYALIIILGLLFVPKISFNIYYVFFAIFLGCLSHIIIDLFTPAGVELLNPLSSQRFKKLAGFTLLVLWAGCVIVSIVLYGNHVQYII